MSLNHIYTTAIVDDHVMFSDSLRQALSTFDFINVIGTYATTEGFLRNFDIKKPEIVFMDIGMKMGKMNGIEATREALNRRPNTIIIGISMHEDVFTVREMLNAGAKGYISKGLSIKNIKYLFEHIQENKIYVSPLHLMSRLDLADEPELNNLPKLKQSDFTPHQLQILHWISYEKSDKEIGTLLEVPTKEIEYQKTKIAKNLGVRKVGAMIARAYELGILPYKS